MRQYDSLKKLFVLGTMVLMLAGIFPIGSLTGNGKVSAALSLIGANFAIRHRLKL